MARLSKRSNDNLEGVHPHLVRSILAALEGCPVDFTIVAGVRTAEQQAALFAKGRTAPGAIVTKADGVVKLSKHQPAPDGFGHAVDLYPYYDGAVQVNAPIGMFERIARHIQGVGAALGYSIVWGGDWKSFRDAPHFEIRL